MLTERQLLILDLIVRHYIEFEEPIGSKTLLKESALSLSSATIRNEMMRIEELGFLEKMHSSSGRIPSIQGYRYYVDQLLGKESEEVADEVKQTIKHGFQNPYREVQQVVEKSAEMLSFLTNYTALAIGPETKDSRLTGFRLVALNEGHVMAILVTDKGHVENQIFSVSPGFSATEIEKIVNIFNQELVGRTLQEVFVKLQTDIPVIIRKYVDAKIDFTAIFNDIVAKLEHDRFHVGGSMNLLNHLDASMDKDKVKAILSMLNGSPDIQALFSTFNDGVGVKIGTELNNELLHNFSLITATYDTAGNGKGLIALLGPTNMPYKKMISIMKFMRYELSGSLNDLNK